MNWAKLKGWSKKLLWPAVGIAAGTALGLIVGAPLLLAVAMGTAGVAGVAIVGKLFDSRPSPLAYVAGGVLGTAIAAASLTGAGVALAGGTEAALVSTGAGASLVGGAASTVPTAAFDDDVVGPANLEFTDWKNAEERAEERAEELRAAGKPDALPASPPPPAGGGLLKAVRATAEPTE